jgi:hypothetical protein
MPLGYPRPDSSVVERGPEKAGVGGSIPSLATTRGAPPRHRSFGPALPFIKRRFSKRLERVHDPARSAPRDGDFAASVQIRKAQASPNSAMPTQAWARTLTVLRDIRVLVNCPHPVMLSKRIACIHCDFVI